MEIIEAGQIVEALMEIKRAIVLCGITYAIGILALVISSAKNKP